MGVKTLGDYLKEDWKSLNGKVFAISSEWTYYCRGVSQNPKTGGEIIGEFEVIDPVGFSDPETLNLTNSTYMHDYVELVEGVNASKRITPAAQALIEKYPKAAPD
jgi:hypothetical protein